MSFADNSRYPKEQQLIDDFLRMLKRGVKEPTLIWDDENQKFSLSNITVFDSIWEFYNHIEWDYKKKRFNI